MSQEGSEDALLIRQVLAGRTEAFGALVTRYQDRVYNVVLRVVGNPDDALEVVQEAFVKAYRSLSSFRGGAQFYTWLYRIAFNTAISRKRRSGRVVTMPMGGGGGDPDGDGRVGLEPEAPAQNPSEGLEREEIRNRVEAALVHVPEDLRQALVLRDMEGMNYEEIAQTLDVAVGTVKSRIHRARLILRERLKDLVENG